MLSISHIMQMFSPSKRKISTTKDILIIDTTPPFIQFKAAIKTFLLLLYIQNTYLEENGQPSVPIDKKVTLEADFTMEEIQTAIGDLKNSRSPGLDGFASHFCKTFTEQLVPLFFFLNVFNFVSPNRPFPYQSPLAHISVIPKPGKDLNQRGIYCPISLINIDLKLYAKMIASHL